MGERPARARKKRAPGRLGTRSEERRVGKGGRGVQTCALPIWIDDARGAAATLVVDDRVADGGAPGAGAEEARTGEARDEIGRASGRERGERSSDVCPSDLDR